jgi:hypothetical protein
VRDDKLENVLRCHRCTRVAIGGVEAAGTYPSANLIETQHLHVGDVHLAFSAWHLRLAVADEICESRTVIEHHCGSAAHEQDCETPQHFTAPRARRAELVTFAHFISARDRSQRIIYAPQGSPA